MNLVIKNDSQLDKQIAEVQWLVNGGWLNQKLVTNLHIMLSNDMVTEVVFQDFNVKSSMWDGTILVKFPKKPDVVKVVNMIIGWARADEVTMENTKTLRLWWD